MTRINRLRIVASTIIALAATSAQAQVVFSTDFNSGVPAQITPLAAAITEVQGYAGLGAPGSTFGGQFLRSPTANVVTINLSGLPTHDAISVDFLFAAIDSLDGSGTFPSGDFFRVTLDGAQIFRESFANALPSQIQSYVPPAGVELARHVDLGFSGPGGNFTDSAYYLGNDPVFQRLAHTGSTATITFQIEGEGNQSLEDESWAMDNLRVSVTQGSVAVPEANCLALVLPAVCCFATARLGIMGAVVMRRRKS